MLNVAVVSDLPVHELFIHDSVVDLVDAPHLELEALILLVRGQHCVFSSKVRCRASERSF